MTIAKVMLIIASLMGAGEDQAKLDVPTQELRVTRSYGGELTAFIDGFAQIRNDSDLKVVIDGPCLSACTLALGLIPSDRLCATERGLFGFHSAWYEDEQGRPTFAKEATRIVWNIYPDYVKKAVKGQGWDGDGINAHPDLLYFKARELVQACD